MIKAAGIIIIMSLSGCSATRERHIDCDIECDDCNGLKIHCSSGKAKITLPGNIIN